MGNKEYVQAGAPDFLKLGELVNRAKGPNRTMAAFAEECGIGPSKLSRVANAKISTPLSLEALASIYEHRDRMFQVPFEVLANANGLVTKETYEQIQVRSNLNALVNLEVQRERAMQNIITTALLDRNVTISRCHDDRMLDSDENAITRTTPSLSLLITGDTAANGRISEPVWNLYFNSSVVANDTEHRTFLSSAVRGARRAVDKAMSLFLKDAWYPEKLSGVRTTFVFCDAAVYKKFITQVKGSPFNSAFTAMLVDVNNMKIIQDTWLSKSDETNGPLSLPVVEADENTHNADFDGDFMEEDE